MSKKVEESVNKFSKEQLMKAVVYKENKDMLKALLEDGKEYSEKQVTEMIKEYKKGKVV